MTVAVGFRARIVADLFLILVIHARAAFAFVRFETVVALTRHLLAGAVDDQRAPRPVTDAISALVNLGYGQPQAAAAIAAASRSAGENAETAQLIRLGLKELAK